MIDSKFDKEELQQEYKDRIEGLFLEIKENSEIITILENLFPRIPTAMFVDKDYYILFEYLLSKDCDIGQKVLWSSDADLRDGQRLFERATTYRAASELIAAHQLLKIGKERFHTPA